MAAIGDIVVLNMIDANDNQSTAGIVVAANEDGTISAYAFPANGNAPVLRTGIAPFGKVDELTPSYGEAEPAPVVSKGTTLPDGTPVPSGSTPETPATPPATDAGSTAAIP